jgi:NAD(P)-dependent dehydrogenase (short-subunit alcohol dehydrogenase family)
MDIESKGLEGKGLEGKTALVIGGNSGVGRATALALVGHGARVIAAARGADRLAALRAETGDQLRTLQMDATDPAAMQQTLQEVRPDLVVLTAGVRLRVGTLMEQTWASFSEPWLTDTQAAFHLVKGALTMPLAPGSQVVVVSSGAAINGSPLSGGYAGAKRMQWLMTGYAQQLSDKQGLGIRFLTVIPLQLIEGTVIGHEASAAYGATMGISAADFMKRYDVPLHPDGVASAIVACLTGEIPSAATAVRVSGKGLEAS